MEHCDHVRKHYHHHHHHQRNVQQKQLPTVKKNKEKDNKIQVITKHRQHLLENYRMLTEKGFFHPDLLKEQLVLIV